MRRKKKKNGVLRNLFNKKRLSKIDTKIDLLGLESKYDAETFLSIRVITSVLLFILIFSNFKYGYIIGIVITIIYYLLFERILLDNKIKLRSKRLDNEAIYFFEVLTLSLQTGRNLAEAISMTTSSIDSELSNEFKEALRETKYGKSLTESLTDMQKYIPSDNINNIILTLTQANMYGSSIIDTMQNQVDYLREKRIMEVKSAISKIPTKISVISVFFFIPLILLIILGPVLLNYLS